MRIISLSIFLVVVLFVTSCVPFGRTPNLLPLPQQQENQQQIGLSHLAFNRETKALEYAIEGIHTEEPGYTVEIKNISQREIGQEITFGSINNSQLGGCSFAINHLEDLQGCIPIDTKQAREIHLSFSIKKNGENKFCEKLRFNVNKKKNNEKGDGQPSNKRQKSSTAPAPIITTEGPSTQELVIASANNNGPTLSNVAGGYFGELDKYINRDMMARIVSYLNYEDMCNFRLACKQWGALFQDSIFTRILASKRNFSINFSNKPLLVREKNNGEQEWYIPDFVNVAYRLKNIPSSLVEQLSRLVNVSELYFGNPSQQEVMQTLEAIGQSSDPYVRIDTLQVVFDYTSINSSEFLSVLQKAIAKLPNLKSFTLRLPSLQSKDEKELVKILTPLKKLQSLNISLNHTNITDISVLGQLSQLRSLDLDLIGTNITNISALGQLSQLTSLDLGLGETNITDISVLGQLSQLTSLKLDLYRTNITDISVLGQLSQLTSLKLGLGRTNITDISVLGQLSQLTSLKLDLYKTNITDISVLGQLSQLTSLDLGLGGADITDISALGQLSQLTSLKLGLGWTNITDISVLGQLSQLTSLNLGLGETNITDISVLNQLSQLTSLNLRKADITDSHIKALSGLLKRLRKLDLSNNTSIGIQGLRVLNSVLQEATQLQELNLSGIRTQKRADSIQEIVKMLQGHTQLQSLNLSDNKIGDSDIANFDIMLKKLTNLQTLDLTGNETGQSGVDLLKAIMQSNPQLHLLRIEVSIGSGDKFVISNR